MKVSVITPVYNCEKYIAKTLKSILSQSYRNFEIILVDDKSNDNSVEIIKEFMVKYDNIKLIILDENSGAAVARNAGIKIAKGDYAAFLDSDDVWSKDKLEKQLAFMQENNYDFTYTYYNKVDEQGQKIGTVKSLDKITYNDILKNNYVGCSTVMINQKKIGKTYMPLLRKRQDYALWLKILKKVEYGFCLKKSLTNYTVRTNSISSNKINLVKYNYNVFRQSEGFGVVKSTYYLINNIIFKLLKIN